MQLLFLGGVWNMQLIKEYVEGGFVSYCDSFAVDVIVDSVEITV